MNKRNIGLVLLSGMCITAGVCLAAESVFSVKPEVKRAGSAATITFALASPNDVEVAVLAADGKVVRHLAAGVLGGANPPPEPLKAGLGQALVWDGKDDFGKPAVGGSFKARIRAGTGVKFGGFIGSNSYNFGIVESVVADEEGNVYVAGARGRYNQSEMCVRVFDSAGRYLREVMPFPADLPPDSMKDIARWDAGRKTFYPRNLRNLDPDFYGQPGGVWANPAFTLVSVSKKSGLVLTDGVKLYTLATSGAVAGQAFASRDLGGIPNTGAGPMLVAISPDGAWAYISGPFSNTNPYGYKFNPDFPPGRVYRVSLNGAGSLKEFVTIPVAHTNGVGGAYTKFNIYNQGVPEGPVHGVAVDAKGNVYVSDREHQCVAVYDMNGKGIGRIPVANPHQIVIHPKTGEIYVLSRTCTGYWAYTGFIAKFKDYSAGAATPMAKYDFPKGGSWPAMALAVGKEKTVVCISGESDTLVSLEDKGSKFELLKTQFGSQLDVPTDWNRMALDYDRDEVYISDGGYDFWRFDGATGKGGHLMKNGKPFYGTDLAVGYDGLLYVKTGNNFTGPLERYTRGLDPAPYAATGTNVLSPTIYGRAGLGAADRGLGVGPDGKVYIAFLYDWVAYAIGGFSGDGKPLPGKYLKGIFPAKKPEGKKWYPAGLDSAIIGPVPQGTANIRVDLNGNIYVGLLTRPKGFVPPKGFEKDQGYRCSVGSVVKFGPEGGAMTGDEKAMAAVELQGAKQVYMGLAPFSSNAEAFGQNTCCVCRVPRFDLDRYGRIVMPNAMTCSVLLYDNAGNLILEFGKYGNFDSQYVNPNTEAGKAGKPTVAVPEIPMAWPTGAGFSEGHLYVNDTYNRRVVRTDLTWKGEETVAIR